MSTATGHPGVKVQLDEEARRRELAQRALEEAHAASEKNARVLARAEEVARELEAAQLAWAEDPSEERWQTVATLKDKLAAFDAHRARRVGLDAQLVAARAAVGAIDSARAARSERASKERELESLRGDTSNARYAPGMWRILEGLEALTEGVALVQQAEDEAQRRWAHARDLARELGSPEPRAPARLSAYALEHAWGVLLRHGQGQGLAALERYGLTTTASTNYPRDASLTPALEKLWSEREAARAEPEAT